MGQKIGILLTGLKNDRYASVLLLHCSYAGKKI